MMEAGKWVPYKPGRKKRGYHISSLYSPIGWVSWLQIVEEFLAAKDDPKELKAWTNTRLAETFEPPGKKLQWRAIQERAEPYKPRTVPQGALFLAAGVDTQDNRLVASVYGFGRGEECWLIHHGEIYGDPAEAEVWAQLDYLLEYPYPRPDGSTLKIVSMAVDSQGHRTQAVYNYARTRFPRVFAIQGASAKNKPVVGRPSYQDVNFAGEVIKEGVMLWPVGTDTVKSILFPNLMKRAPETGEICPGYIHFPMGLGEEFYLQLTAEKLEIQYKNGVEVSEWVKVRKRNEALDCLVYAYAAAYRAGLPMIDWDGLEASITGKPKPAQQNRPPKERKRNGTGLLKGSGLGRRKGGFLR